MRFLDRLIRWILGLDRPPPGGGPSVSPDRRASPTPDDVHVSSPVSPESPGEGVAAPREVPHEGGDTSDPRSTALKPKASGSIGVEAGDFLPITREEIKETAGGPRSLFSNAWFGRRDLIPPVDDPRTMLIDRALVTHGLLSPEQLAEIHRVGAEMERLRPTQAGIEHLASRQGEAAVQADRDRLAQVKAKKKAVAAERKRLEAEAIASRHGTDIIFLGRGVSGRLKDRRSDIERLSAAGLPVLSSPAELAEALGLTVPRLRWLAFHTEVASRTHYVQVAVPKRAGGTRLLSVPHRGLSQAQRWIFDQVVGKLGVEPTAHGFVSGRGILTNAAPHVAKAVVVNMDLEAFFPSIGFARVRSVFHRLGYSPAVATVLALLCTECPRRRVVYDGVPYHVSTGPRGLPQGACTSPPLSNQVARRLDRRLLGLADRLGLSYTRYADDLTFSGDDPLRGTIGYLMARVRHIAQDEGFTVNETKSRVLRRNSAQIVTGLVVNDRPGVPREEIRRLRAILHRARTEGLERQNRAGHPNFPAWLRGKIAYVAMSRPEVGAQFRAELAALRERELATSPLTEQPEQPPSSVAEEVPHPPPVPQPPPPSDPHEPQP